jgi:hypothetical protein
MGYAIVLPILILVALLFAQQEMVTADGKISMLIVAEWLIICAALFGMKKKMFPKMMFNIGKSADLGTGALFWRKLVGTGIGVGLAVAIIGGFIVEKIVRP